MDKVIVVKIGGSTLGKHDTTMQDLVTLQQEGRRVVVVHGGGKVITDWLAKQGIATRAVRGERVTDAASLEVVIAVLAGLVNKQIVSEISRRGGKAIGISGADGDLVQGKVKDQDLGYVGEVTGVNLAPLEALLQSGYMPVVATVGIASRTDKSASLLNINADTVAGEIACAIGAASLIFLTDVPGVQDGQGGLLCQLTAKEARELINSGVASGGMVPKINACLRAVQTCPVARIIDGRQPHALLRETQGAAGGTTIQAP